MVACCSSGRQRQDAELRRGASRAIAPSVASLVAILGVTHLGRSRGGNDGAAIGQRRVVTCPSSMYHHDQEQSVKVMYCAEPRLSLRLEEELNSQISNVEKDFCQIS